MNIELADAPEFRPAWGNGSPTRKSRSKMNAREREFIAWDGEGARTPQGRQNYVLLGASTGDTLIAENLRTADMLDFIIRVGRDNPDAIHVGFAFDYDTNMILRNLTPHQFRILRRTGSVRYGKYRIEHVPHKWLQITHYDGPKETGARTTVRICDVWGFFQASFIKALQAYIPNHPLMAELQIIEDGKADRKNFTYDRIEEIRRYWWLEIRLMVAMCDQLREWLYDCGLFITQWHGPGAIANYGYRTHGIKRHKADCGEEVYDAARYAYAGGRFERFHIGRYEQGFGIDINSAYPYAISKLPSLTEGYWRHTDGIGPDGIQEFAVYRVRLSDTSPIAVTPSPLFHRDSRSQITYPWITEGWYWAPEVATLRRMRNVEIVEGYEYVDWHTRPFEFVRDVYAQRREMKAAGIGSQMALKLFLNSLYGKMAQRVGWERTGKAPTWHQLEWAGWVTSATRAKLFSVMARIPYDQLIAVETDGIYTTFDPAKLGIHDSAELGGWEVTPFDEIMYVQSGMYAKRSGDKWETKYRGLDAKSLTPDSVREFLRALTPHSEWPSLSGPTTRFVGYRQALWREDQGMGPMKMHHCRWETDEKEMSAGGVGKRVHSPRLCGACEKGANALELPHDTVIKSLSMFEPKSARHDIPWINGSVRAEWRDMAEGLV